MHAVNLQNNIYGITLKWIITEGTSPGSPWEINNYSKSDRAKVRVNRLNKVPMRMLAAVTLLP